MKNVYLQQYQDILEAYQTKLKALNRQIEENNRNFSAEYAEQQNKEIRAEKEKTYEEAKDLIRKNYEETKLLLSTASFIDVEDMTADRLIFESGFQLTKQDIRAYLERYKDNFTMKRLICDWVKKQPKPEQYGDIVFATPEEQLEVYKRFGEKAMYVANGIYGERKEHFIPLEIESFQDETMCARELAVIGDGKALEQYRSKSKRMPETQLHIFDGVQMDEYKGQGNENSYMH